MQVRVSTDDLPPRDRVKFWCDYFAKQAHSITPGEIPNPGSFRAEARGSVAGEFALLDITSGLERVQRTGADVGRDLAMRRRALRFVLVAGFLSATTCLPGAGACG